MSSNKRRKRSRLRTAATHVEANPTKDSLFTPPAMPMEATVESPPDAAGDTVVYGARRGRPIGWDNGDW